MDEVDRLLVEGEVITIGDTEQRVFPSQAEVAARYGVARSLVNAFWKKHRCQHRRAEYQRQLASKGPYAPERMPGRPLKSEAPRLPRIEVDRLLVFGKQVQLPGGSITTVYPSYREIGEQYGVSSSTVAQYARDANCMKRRQEIEERIGRAAGKELVRRHAKAEALTKADIVQMLDMFLLGFGQALEEGRVRVDNPTDLNTVVRLREFVLGGADSRKEVHTTLSLDSLQERYARMMRETRDVPPELTGMQVPQLPIATSGAEVTEPSESDDETEVVDDGPLRAGRPDASF